METSPNSREGIEKTLRKEYRQKTLQMAKEVSASGTYDKVEGMICDWWLEKLHQELQKARAEQNTVLLAYQMSLEAGNVAEVLTDIKNRIKVYQSNLDQPNK